MSSDPHRGPEMDESVARLRQRQRLLNVCRHAGHGLLAGSVLAVVTAVTAVVARAEWSNLALWLSVLWVPIGAVLGAALGLMRPIDSLRLARSLDQAADGEDRFASAVQLRGHRRRSRARLVVNDALKTVSGTTARAALPLRAPRGFRWLPLALLALAVLLVVGPGQRLEADSEAPLVSAEEWADLYDAFREQLDRFPPPAEHEINRQLEDIAAMLKSKPDAKDALAELARARAEMEQRRQSIAPRDLSLRDIARAVTSSPTLQDFASLLLQGDYERAARELGSLADRMAAGDIRLTASDFEAIARDFEQLSAELAPLDQLQQASQRAANAAGAMNRQRLSDSLRKLSETLQKNAKELDEYAKCFRAGSMLDELCKRLGQCAQCAGCSNGCAACRGSGALVLRSDKKGGLRAGWGTAENWGGGLLGGEFEQRLPDVLSIRETAGANTSYASVSTQEEAESALDFKAVYAEMVRKAEADLDLEMVPIAYRDYLRRYFRAIKPEEDFPEGESGN